MDWFVCGDFASLTCGTWIAIWNGAIGAVFAAILGALVALGVVFLTNRYNARQAEATRQMSAIADLVAAAETCVHDREPNSRGVAPTDVVLLMRSALVRLEMSGKDARPLVEVLRGWPYDLHRVELLVGPAKRLDTELQKAAWPILRSSVAALMTYAPNWTSGDKLLRAGIIQNLTLKGLEMSLYLGGRKAKEPEPAEVTEGESE